MQQPIEKEISASEQLTFVRDLHSKMTASDASTSSGSTASGSGSGEKAGVLWLDVQGLASVELLRGLADIFRIPALALDDIINTPQRVILIQYVVGWVLNC